MFPFPFPHNPISPPPNPPPRFLTEKNPQSKSQKLSGRAPGPDYFGRRTSIDKKFSPTFRAGGKTWQTLEKLQKKWDRLGLICNYLQLEKRKKNVLIFRKLQNLWNFFRTVVALVILPVYFQASSLLSVNVMFSCLGSQKSVNAIICLICFFILLSYRCKLQDYFC